MKIDDWILKYGSIERSINGLGKHLYPDTSHAMAAVNMQEILIYRAAHKTTMHPITLDLVSSTKTLRLRSRASVDASFSVYLLEEIFTNFEVKEGFLEVVNGEPMPAIFTCREFEGWGVMIAPARITKVVSDKEIPFLPIPVSSLDRWG